MLETPIPIPLRDGSPILEMTMVPSFNDSCHFRHASQWTFRFPSRSSLRDRPSFVRPPRFPILPAGSITYCVATASDIVLGFDSLHAVRRYFPFPPCAVAGKRKREA